jgi:hypothetical protein
MQTHDFLSAVLGGTGYICVFGANPAKKRVIQKLYATIEAACSAADNLCQEGFDAYFGLARFQTDKNRRADNALSLKSFFLDIDCGAHKDETEGYPGGQADGLVALRQFCIKVGLPKPTIVSSGRGLHIYWVLSNPISVQEWTPVAERLKDLCSEHGLVADPAVTSDTARVLRVPGTSNFKDSPPSEVKIISATSVEVDFDAFRDLIGAPKSVLKSASLADLEDDIAAAILGNYKNSFKTIVIKTAEGRGCNQIKQIIEEQDTISEPMWRGGLSIAKFCEDGVKAAHRISHKHPGYSQEETSRKLDQIKGPYTCATFDKLNPDVCTQCTHKGIVKSPIVLGREVQEAPDDGEVYVEDVPEAAPIAGKQQYAIPKYPTPYFRGVHGGVFKRIKDKHGDPLEVPVYHNDLYVIRRLHDPEVGEALVIRLHLPRDGVREFTIPLAASLSKEEFRKYMASNGVAMMKMEELMAYITTWVNKLQNDTNADIARRQFGWTDETCSAFVIGDKEIHANRIEHNPPSSSTLRMFSMCKSRGSLEEWKKVVDFYNRPGMEMYQYVVALSFGSPLVAHSPDGSALFHMFSKDPGLGKTTAMRVGNSIWGHPNEMMCQERDTFNSKMNRADVFKNVFLTMDELTNIQPKDASDFAYALTGGTQRNRLSMGGNVERLRGDPWRLNVCSTGNTSLISRIMMYKAMPKAETVRIVEAPVTAYSFDSKIETDAFGQLLLNNYGHACVPYMQFLLQRGDESKKLFFSMQERVDKAAGLLQPHRFWSAQAASALAGAVISKKAGLINYDIPELFKWIVGVLIRNKTGYIEGGTNAEEILTTFLAENYNNILRIKSTEDARGAADPDICIIPDNAPRFQFVARYEYDVRRLYIIPKVLREWCGKQQIPYGDVVDELRHGRTKATMKKQRLGKGTRMNLPPMDVLVLDCSDFMIDLEDSKGNGAT